MRPNGYEQETYLPILETALEEEIGMFVRTDHRNYLEKILFALRKAKEPEFDELAIFTPVIDGRDDILFIAKRTVELPE